MGNIAKYLFGFIKTLNKIYTRLYLNNYTAAIMILLILTRFSMYQVYQRKIDFGTMFQ